MAEALVRAEGLTKTFSQGGRNAFGGRESFVRETAYLAELCRTTPVAPGRPPVRLPGEGALARRRHHLRAGVPLPPTAMPALEPWAAKYGVPLPQ